MISLLDVDIPEVCSKRTVFAESELLCYTAFLFADALMGRHNCTENEVYRVVGAYLKWAPARYKKIQIPSDS